MENEISISANCPYHIDLKAQAVVETANPTNIIPLKGLPTYEIAGTKFYVEINAQALIEVGDPSNTLALAHMQDHGTHYSMRYHLGYKNWPSELDPVKESIDVNIPPLVVLDPHGMAKKYNVDVNDVKNKTDIEFLDPNYRGFLERVSGILPHIDINGQDFIIDFKAAELRSAEGPEIRLNFKDFEPGSRLEDDFSYRFFYDCELQKVIKNESIPLSGHVVKVELPERIRMDPVWVARQNGLEDKGYIRDHPVQKDLKARIADMTAKLQQTDSLNRNKRKRGNRL